MSKYLLDTNTIIYALNQGLKLQIRRDSKLKLPDSIIVASALDNDTILVTSDKQLLNAQVVKTIELNQL
ncbi:hypothetical protein NG754_09640 [Aliarcobacter cryaerophilus]|uniref:hypothetical protein n=1 Tax=Aliarcobacter cryaerophilus TaxID=28198 RepID=UPI003DA57C3D